MSDGAGLPVPFVDLILQPLSQPGKIFGSSDPSMWTRLVDACCTAVSGNTAAAIRVAAAVEVLIAALDVLDEVEDGDQSSFIEKFGTPRALNASTALLFFSQKLLMQLPVDGIDPAMLPRFFNTVSSFGLAATAGQDQDLSTTASQSISLENALRICSGKSGSLAACACALGSLLGTIDEESTKLFAEFGGHFGTMLQLSNDLHDAHNDTAKSDLRQKKPTLPLVYFERSNADDATAVHSEDISRTGALHFTWVVVELERTRCSRILEQVAQRGFNVVPLRSLVS